MNKENPAANIMQIDLARSHYETCRKSFGDSYARTISWKKQKALASWQANHLDIADTSGSSTLTAAQGLRETIDEYVGTLADDEINQRTLAETWLSDLAQEASTINNMYEKIRELRTKPVHDRNVEI